MKNKLIAILLTLITLVFGILKLLNPFWWITPKLNIHSQQNFQWSLKAKIFFKLDVIYQNIFHKLNPKLRKVWLEEIDLKLGDGHVKGDITALAEIDVDNFDFNDFENQYRLKQKPVVIRNFLKDDIDFDTWDYDQFVSKFSNETVNLTCPVKDGYKGQLKELNIPGVYLHNSESILRKFPKLNQKAGLEVIRKKLAPNLFFTGLSQLFVGKKKLGTWWHCAGGINFFIQLSGQKKWTFIDPNNTELLIPLSVGKGSSAYYIAESGITSKSYQSFYSKLKEQDKNNLTKNLSLAPERLKNLYESCNKYEVIMNPGDVLLSPAWYWHDVENITETSIGMATRWLDPKRPKLSNSLFDLGTKINPNFFYTAVMSILKQKELEKKTGANRDEEDLKEYGAHFTRASDFSQFGAIDEDVKNYYKRVIPVRKKP